MAKDFWFFTTKQNIFKSSEFLCGLEHFIFCIPNWLKVGTVHDLTKTVSLLLNNHNYCHKFGKNSSHLFTQLFNWLFSLNYLVWPVLLKALWRIL